MVCDIFVMWGVFKRWRSVCGLCAFGGMCKICLCSGPFSLHHDVCPIVLCIHSLEVWCVSMCDAWPVCLVVVVVVLCKSLCCPSFFVMFLC